MPSTVPVRSKTHTLLVVDDETGILHAIQETLADCQYQMILTTDPRHALQLLKADPSIDVLITDLYMPSMDGVELLKEGRGIRPDLGIVLTTGLASTEQLRRWRARGELIIGKPWRSKEFENTVEKALLRRTLGPK